MRIKYVKTKCLNCKKNINATAKVDDKGNVTKYVEIYGGIRKPSPQGYTATYCLRCADKIIQPIDPVPVTPLPKPPSPLQEVLHFVKGERVKYLLHSEWGVGQLLTDSSDNRAYVYFVNAGKKKIALMENEIIYNNLIRVSDETSDQPLLDFLEILEQSKKYCKERDSHNLYVVELRSIILNDPSFAARNINSDRTKRCLYVGMTGLSPEERYRKHIEGYKAAYYVKTYHAEPGLLTDFFECLNPMPQETAKKMEKEFAEALRKQGFPVWWN